MTAPIITAKGMYEKFGATRSFDRDLDAHLRHGYVVSSPYAFAMGRPVRHDAPVTLLADISYRFRHPDCWLVWSAAGDLRYLVWMLPDSYPLIAFHRTSARRAGPGPLRVYRFDRLQSLATALPGRAARTE